MAINPNRKKFTHGLDERRVKAIRYFTIILIVLVPIFFVYQGISNIKPKEPVQKVSVETGDRPVEKSVSITIKADGGLNFRKDPKKDGEKIGKIPDGTKLTVRKEIDGWYQVNFDSKDGWIAKEFTVSEEETKAKEQEENATKDWISFNGAAYGFNLKYPVGWSAQDYGKQPDTDSVIGFSFSQLPTTLQPGFFIPIDIRISERERAGLEAPYSGMAQKTVSEVDISGIKGVKYLYTDATDSTEKSKIFMTIRGKTVIISENGGYGAELEQIIKSFKSS